MATVEECISVAKAIARKVRSDVFSQTDCLLPHDLMVVNSRLALSLRELAAELEEFIPINPEEKESERT